MKKLNKWLIAIICAVVAVAGIVAAVLLFGGQDAAQTQQPPMTDGKLYWNVERESYKTGQYTHQKVGDDLYRVLFAVDGEQVKLDVRGYFLVQEIDTLDVMGLEFDEEGFVIGVYNVEECTGGYAAKTFYVESVEGNTVVANNNAYFTGYSKTLELTEETGVYDVSDSGPLCGMRSKVKYNDEIVAIEDKDGNITHVFTKPYVYPNNVYWNVDKPYDSVNKISTRQPNALMQYEMDFILNGELVTYICRDPEVVNKIDGSRVCGLEFDENGEIIGYISVKVATNGGRLGATNYYVESLDYHNGLYGFRKSSVPNPLDSIGSFYPREDMVVYDMTGNNGPKGIVTEIQMNDRIICVLDNRSMISMAYVVARAADSPLYWNVDRNWNKTTQSTNRRPDSNGWYYFKMAVNGKQITVKTDDLAIANAIESPVNVGLRLNGDVVEQVYSSSAVYPAGVFGSWYTITDISADGTITAQKTSNGVTSTKTGKVAENCEYYNVSGTANMEGEKTSFSTLKVGDVIHSYRNFDGEITIIYVVTSHSSSPIYWNVDKAQYWDSKNKVSTREKDADGYYNILLAVNGKQVTLRTRSKKIVDDIDGRTCMGLNVSGTTIMKVFGATQTVNTKGGLFASSWYVTAINGKTITASNGTKTESRTMAYNCQVYDVSNTADMVGQKTTVKVGDQIRGLMNSGKQISVLYVLNTARHANEHPCDHCGQDVNWIAWDGNSYMADGGHYILNSDVVITKGPNVTEGVTATLCLNGYQLTRETARVFGDIKGTLNIVDCVGTGHVHGQTNNNASVGMVSGGTLNIYGGKFTANEVTEAGKNGGIFTIIGGGQINLYDGVITGGKTTGFGGNINISDGTVTVHKGEISGGTSGEGQYGGNIALSGENAALIIHDGLVSGGTSGSYGGNIGVAKTGAQLTINGGTVENGTAATHGGNITVALGSMTINGGTISGGTAANFGSSMSFVNDTQIAITDATITGGQVRASNTGGLTLGGKLTVDELYLYNIPVLLSQDKPLTDAQIYISMATPGVFVEQTETDLSDCFYPFDANGIVLYENQQMLLHMGHAHCVCIGADAKPAEHECDEKVVWTAINADDSINLEDGGHYFLNWKGENKAKAIKVADNATAYLCLNGSVVRAQTLVTLGTDAHLIICDCSEDQSGALESSKNSPIQIVAGQQVSLYSGTISGTNHYNGGAVQNATTVTMNAGSFYMYGGQLLEGYSSGGNGGNVFMTGASQFYMYGGTITGGYAAKKGGNVAMINTNARFYMYGGQITDGTAGTFGGNVSLNNGAQFIMDGTDALIANGNAPSTNAAQGGGNIHIHHANGKFTLINGAITGGTAANKGGSVMLENGLLDVQGGSIAAGAAGVAGNCVYVATNGTVTVAENASVADIYDVDAIEE